MYWEVVNLILMKENLDRSLIKNQILSLLLVSDQTKGVQIKTHIIWITVVDNMLNNCDQIHISHIDQAVVGNVVHLLK